MFGFFKKKPSPKPSAPADPLAAYDGFIEAVERQASEVRRSAATLLALRGELTRDREKYSRRVSELGTRTREAVAKGDARAEKTLARDAVEAQAMLEASERALVLATDDAKLLLTAAEGLNAKVRELKSERQSARARLSAGQVVSAALQQQVEEFERVIALDAARDEVEKAHALADIYRDDQSKKREE